MLSSSHMLYVILKNRAGVFYRDLKHEATVECFRFDKAHVCEFFKMIYLAVVHLTTS